MWAWGKGSSPGRVEGSSRAMLATARRSCLLYILWHSYHCIPLGSICPKYCEGLTLPSSFSSLRISSFLLSLIYSPSLTHEALNGASSAGMHSEGVSWSLPPIGGHWGLGWSPNQLCFWCISNISDIDTARPRPPKHTIQFAEKKVSVEFSWRYKPLRTLLTKILKGAGPRDWGLWCIQIWKVEVCLLQNRHSSLAVF